MVGMPPLGMPKNPGDSKWVNIMCIYIYNIHVDILCKCIVYNIFICMKGNPFYFNLHGMDSTGFSSVFGSTQVLPVSFVGNLLGGLLPVPPVLPVPRGRRSMASVAHDTVGRNPAFTSTS